MRTPFIQRSALAISALIFLLLSLFSCTTDPATDADLLAEGEELVTYNFKMGGELNVSESSMKQAETVSNDLFAIQFYDRSTGNPAAYVVGDDISKVTLDLKKGREYSIKTTFVKGGKNLIYNYNNRWGVPFDVRNGSVGVLNKPYYTSFERLEYINKPYINLQDGNWWVVVPVERFYGFLDSFTAESDGEILLDLKKVVFGMKLTLDFGEESTLTKVRFSYSSGSNDPAINYVEIVNGKGTLEFPFLTLGGYLDDVVYDYSNYGVDMGYEYVYTENLKINLGTEDNYTLFYDGNINIKRMVMHNISFTGSAVPGSQNAVSLSLEETEMTEEDIDISNGY